MLGLLLASCATGLQPLVRPALGLSAPAADFATVKGLAAEFPVVNDHSALESLIPQLTALGPWVQGLVFMGMLDVACFKGNLMLYLAGMLDLVMSGEIFDVLLGDDDDDDDDFYWDDDDFWW